MNIHNVVTKQTMKNVIGNKLLKPKQQRISLNTVLIKIWSTWKERFWTFALYLAESLRLTSSWKFKANIILDKYRKYSRKVCYSWSLTSLLTTTHTFYYVNVIGWTVRVTNSNSCINKYVCSLLKLHLHCEWESGKDAPWSQRDMWKDQSKHVPSQQGDHD